MKSILSPLRYPGSKRYLLSHINKILAVNKIEVKIYIEPFVGGGSVFLQMLKNNAISKIIISDIDPIIYSFWKILFSKPEILINFVNKVGVNLDNFYKFKNVLNNDKKYDDITLAKACLYINRTSYSGLLTSNVGPLGGASQKSDYLINCRFNKREILNRLKIISGFAKKVYVYNHDWLKLLNLKPINELNSNCVCIYLDPPFFNKADNLYRRYFVTGEHKKLKNYLREQKKFWILSYDDADEILSLYSNTKFNKAKVKIPYSVNHNSRRHAKELLISNMSIPRDKEYFIELTHNKGRR